MGWTCGLSCNEEGSLGEEKEGDFGWVWNRQKRKGKNHRAWDHYASWAGVRKWLARSASGSGTTKITK